MDNYLSYRWPSGSDGRPGDLPMPPRRRKRDSGREDGLRLWQWFLIGLCVVLGIGVIASASFLIIAITTARMNPSAVRPSADPRPAYTEQPFENWSPEDLPWTAPAPGVFLALAQGEGETLSAAQIYDKALPSVVCVTADLKSGRGYKTGTGFIVESSGYILTNFHIIDEGSALEIMLLSDNSVYEARVVGYDEEFDLAVLKIDGQDLPAAELGDSDGLAVGDPVYAIGNPMGYLYGSMTNGIVSALGRDNTDANGLALIQTSAPLNSGNSGGPLLDASGRVVGITSAKITGVEEDTVIEGLGLAIPTTDLLPFVNRILATGASWRPSIGITCVVASVGDRTGIKVQEVTADTAYEAGLRPGDLIVAANGRETPTLAALRRILYTTGVEGTVTCTVLRGGEELELTFALIDTLGRAEP